MPVSIVKKDNQWHQIRGDKIMAVIRAVFCAADPSIGLSEADISVCSTCAGGAMELLVEQVYPDTIRLVGRWRIETMIHYLHTTANIFTEGLATKIFQHSTYELIPPAHAWN